MPDERCDELREPVAELALGIASGEQRARVLDHTGRCASCQRLLGELTLVGDELLQLAPEARAAPRLRGARGRAPRAPAQAAPPARAARTARRRARGRGRGGGDRAGADRGRAAPRRPAPGGASRAHGKYLAVAELRDRPGREAGLVFHYGGEPSWIFVTLERPLPPGRYVATLVMRTGRTSELGTHRLGGGALSFGATTRSTCSK